MCYTNHAEADQDDMDTLLTLLGVAGCNYIMGVPGADDIMLGYQSTSFHDSHYLRQVLGLRPAPEFESLARIVGSCRQQQSPAVGDRTTPAFVGNEPHLMKASARECREFHSLSHKPIARSDAWQKLAL